MSTACTLTIDELAEELDISVPTLRRYQVDGMPFTKGKSRRHGHLYNAAECAAWMKANGRTGEMGRPFHSCKTGETRNEGRIREIVEVLLGMSAELAPQLVGMTVNEIQDRVDADVRRLLGTVDLGRGKHLKNLIPAGGFTYLARAQ